MKPKLILYIACSLDGYIAKTGDDLSFLDKMHIEDEDYGYQAFNESVDTIIMGRRTYDWVMQQVPKFPHADKESYILTRTAKPNEGNLHFYSGDVPELVQRLKNKDEKHIYCDGGAQVVHILLNQ